MSPQRSSMLVSTRSGAMAVWPTERPVANTPLSFAAWMMPACPALSLPPITSAPPAISESAASLAIAGSSIDWR